MVGQEFLIQDSNDSGNYQKWRVISPSPVQSGPPNYWTYNVQLINSAGTGTTNIPNNEVVILAPFAFAGTSGTSG